MASPIATADKERKAKEAFVDDNFELAADLYSQALELDPKSADLYADRAQANIKLGNFPAAVSDANKAIELDSSMVKAYLRKGLDRRYCCNIIFFFTPSFLLFALLITACMKLEEYETAKAALSTGLELAPGDSRFNRLIKECDERIADETKGLSKNAMLSSSQSFSSPSDIDVEIANSDQPQYDVGFHSQESVQSKPKFRHDYYNTPTEMVLTIFAKGIPPQNVHVEFGEQILSISVDIPGEDSFLFQPRLFGKIIPEKCKYVVFSTKIEIRLLKAQATLWPTLEYNKDKALPRKLIVQSEVKSQRPSYPSSKNKVEWDKLEAEVKKEEKDEKLDGDAALNKLFRDIYQNADDDMRRAMCKSFVESSGTVLSTNWKDVGAKKVDGSPPEGMEMKKWEY
ncbi:hypothetical protein KSP40_PGU011755 [Platanthera guangdongensis]|uniref:Uncharacterized protein n=1 Tax=Platanthera guangdongensis TaxID=2320717 RepID=A0ABR2N1Y8_9ASPA